VRRERRNNSITGTGTGYTPFPPSAITTPHCHPKKTQSKAPGACQRSTALNTAHCPPRHKHDHRHADAVQPAAPHRCAASSTSSHTAKWPRAHSSAPNSYSQDHASPSLRANQCTLDPYRDGVPPTSLRRCPQGSAAHPPRPRTHTQREVHRTIHSPGGPHRSGAPSHAQAITPILDRKRDGVPNPTSFGTRCPPGSAAHPCCGRALAHQPLNRSGRACESTPKLP
jgi:hypothetical protein